MACDAQTLATDGQCLLQLNDRQLLASIAYMLAVAVGQEPTAANLTALSKCLVSRSERELLAMIAYLQCQIAGG